MPAYKVWDLVKVPFPYTNRPIQQRRPALVIAIPQTSAVPDLMWVLMVTSAANRSWSGDVTVTDLVAAGLPIPSVVRCNKIATIEATSTEPIGHLPDPDRQHVIEAIRKNLATAITL